MANHFVIPPDGHPLDPSWLEPLQLIADAVPGPDMRESDAFFNIHDFIVAGRIVRSSAPDITVYEHRYTHGLLYIDAAGQTYRREPPRHDGSGVGRFYRHRSFRHALLRLGLWTLPDLKPILAPFRPGWAEERLAYLDELDRLAEQ